MKYFDIFEAYLICVCVCVCGILILDCEALEEYFKRLGEVVHGLGKAFWKSLGLEKCYIEKEFNLESGFDLSIITLYPPNFQSKGSVGLPSHPDPGVLCLLCKTLTVVSKYNPIKRNCWVNVTIPPNTIFIQIGDQLEVINLYVLYIYNTCMYVLYRLITWLNVLVLLKILSNGKFKSHVHRVMVEKNKVKWISVGTLRGPSLDTFVKPATEFVDDSHPPAYLGMTYKRSLEANGDAIDVQSCIQQPHLSPAA